MTFEPFQKFSRIAKIDEASHSTYGIMQDETPDAVDEIADYPTQKDLVKEWSQFSYDATAAARTQPSWGNMRWQHSLEIAGKVCAPPTYDDEKRQIWIQTRPTPEKWPLIRDGIAVGVSVGGQYVRRWCNDCGTDIAQGNDCPVCLKHVLVRYSAKLAECSYTDRPANPSATFQFVRADGATEVRKFRANPAVSLAGTWQEDSTGFEADGIPHNVFIPPLPESDLTGFEGQGLPDDPTKPPDWSISSDDMAGDSTGFEGMRKQCL